MKTLILVDIQNDFLPGGNLAVPLGDGIIPLINILMPKFDLILATMDFHPPCHKSFASTHQKRPGDIIRLGNSEQILWPDHCIQNTHGAKFPNQLKTDRIKRTFFKGIDPEVDSYSGFFDNDHTHSTGLYEYLKYNKIKEFYLAGLTSDYCVKYTALDGLRLGFKVLVIADASRGLNKGDTEKAFEEIRKLGGIITYSNSI